jgi:hypothetical protein
MPILSSKSTQLDSWDTVFFNKARASFDNYEESHELSKRRQRLRRCRRGSLTDSSSEDSSEVDKSDVGIFLSILLSKLLSKDGAKGAVSFGGSLIK